MANFCDFAVTLWAAEKPLRDIVNLLTPAIEEGYHNDILHLDRVFDDLDREGEHVYLDLRRDRRTDKWLSVVPRQNLSANELDDSKRLAETVERLGIAQDAEWMEAFQTSHMLVFGGTSKWAAPAPLAGRLCRLFPIVLCEVAGTTNDTDYERWLGAGGKLCLVDEWEEDFRQGRIVYHRRDGAVFDPPEEEHYGPEDGDVANGDGQFACYSPVRALRSVKEDTWEVETEYGVRVKIPLCDVISEVTDEVDESLEVKSPRESESDTPEQP